MNGHFEAFLTHSLSAAGEDYVQIFGRNNPLILDPQFDDFRVRTRNVTVEILNDDM